MERTRPGLHELDTELQKLLKRGDFDAALQCLMRQTSSGVHLMLNEIGPLAGGEEAELVALLKCFEWHVERKHHADVVMTYLALALQIHSDMFQGDGEIAEELRAISARLTATIQSSWGRLDDQCHKLSCYLKVFTNVSLEAV